MKTRQLGEITIFAAIMLVALTQLGWATSPYTPTIDANEDMENDVDAYTPSDFNPLNDPNLAGLPPGVGGADTGLPNGSPGEDWGEFRNAAGSGVIEEVASGFGGISAPDGSAHYAVVQFDNGVTAVDGPFGRENRDRFTPRATLGRYFANMDLYIDPTRPRSDDGLPDFWLTNAVNGDGTTANPNGYLSESGMTGTVDAGGLTWSIHTTNGVFMVQVPVGTWIGYEMEPIPSTLNPGLVAFEHRVYSDGGTHSVQIGGTVIEEYLAGALGTYAQLTGPRYTWFTNAYAEMDYVLVDNVGWVSVVPEPNSLALASLGFIGMIATYRRRRRSS